LNYAIAGATSLFTTVEDELKWVHNYETYEVGGKEVIDQMFEQGVLNDGTRIDYAFGLNIGEYKGHKAIGHGGSDAGYRTYAVRFPDEKLCITVFSNAGAIDPTELANKVADVFLPEQKEEGAKTEPRHVDETTFKKCVGHFTSDEGLALSITGDSKQVVHVYDQDAEIQSLTDTSFSIFGGYATFFFKKTDKPIDRFKVKIGDDIRDYFRYELVALSSSEVDGYVGTYESDELDSRYQIVNVNGQLTLRHSKYPDAPLTAVTRDQFTCPMWWMDNLNITRDGKKVVAFEVNNGRVLHLKYRKIK
jgi:hypothetical protein